MRERVEKQTTQLQDQSAMRNTVSIGSYKNIRIELHASWFLIFLLLIYSLATAFFPVYFTDFSQTEYWILAVIASLLLFVCIFLHELAHSLTAVKNKIPIEKITLFFFGGVSSIDDTAITPSKELKIAIAGPLFSLVLAALFYVIDYYITNSYVSAISFYLTRLNFVLGIFNLVPGYPLDGGRVFRAIVWMITKNMRKATKYAAFGGKVFAWLLLFLGTFIIFFNSNFAGLWYVILGIFLLLLANASYQQVIVRDIFSKIELKDLLVTQIAPLEHDLTLRQLSERFLRSSQRLYLINKNDKLIGFLTVDFLRRIPEYKWDIVTAEEIAAKIDYIKISSDVPLHQIFGYMLLRDFDYVLVIDKNKVLGIVEKNRLLNYVRLFS